MARTRCIQMSDDGRCIQMSEADAMPIAAGTTAAASAFFSVAFGGSNAPGKFKRW